MIGKPLAAPLPVPAALAELLPVSAETLRGLVEAIPDAIVVTDSGGRMVLVNSQTERLFGYSREELHGQPVELLVPERFRERHVGLRAAYTADPHVRPMGVGLELFGRRKDGHEIPIELGLSPLDSAGTRLVVASVRDVSDRRKADAQFKKMAARYRTLVEGIPAVTFMAAMDDAANEMYVSPQIEELLGFTAKEWMENPILWYTQLHPEDQSRWHEQFARTVATGDRFREVYRFIARDGRVVWVQGEAQVVRDDDGRPLFMQGIAFDITALKAAEEELRAVNATLERRVEERTREVVEHAAELARSNQALSEFTYVVTHDLREPLRTMKSYLQKLANDYQSRLPADPARPEGQGAEFITRSMNAADRMRVLIDDLLKYSRVRPEGKEPVPVDCGEAVAAACANLQATIDETGGSVAPGGPLPTVLADPTQITQLFQNLFANALKFRSEGQPPAVRVSARRDGAMWVIDVADNGIGIEPEYLQKIFKLGVESRMHSRSKYPGHGIGLATCEKIVQLHGGEIKAHSAGPGRGTTISITLPAADR